MAGVGDHIPMEPVTAALSATAKLLQGQSGHIGHNGQFPTPVVTLSDRQSQFDLIQLGGDGAVVRSERQPVIQPVEQPAIQSVRHAVIQPEKPQSIQSGDNPSIQGVVPSSHQLISIVSDVTTGQSVLAQSDSVDTVRLSQQPQQALDRVRVATIVSDGVNSDGVVVSGGGSAEDRLYGRDGSTHGSRNITSDPVPGKTVAWIGGDPATGGIMEKLSPKSRLRLLTELYSSQTENKTGTEAEQGSQEQLLGGEDDRVPASASHTHSSGSHIIEERGRHVSSLETTPSEAEVTSQGMEPSESILLRSLVPHKEHRLHSDTSGNTLEEESLPSSKLSETGWKENLAQLDTSDLEEEEDGESYSGEEDDDYYYDYNLLSDYLDSPQSETAPLEEELQGGVQYLDYQSQFPPGLVRLPYNFSGLQFIELTEVPRVWNARDAFMEQVGYKLYMFLPAAVAGVLLGIIIWVCALLLLRTYGVIRTRLCGHNNNKPVQDMDHIELKPGHVMVARGGGPDILWQSVQEKKHGPRVMESNHHQTASSRYFDTGKVQEFNQSVVDLVRRGYMASEQEDTEPASSSRSSPKSISSGIGVSEKESHSEKEEEEEEESSDRRGTEEVEKS